ncbi:MAG: TolC family protein [Burkholderiales bacterium]|nr:TolC family protein [Burkholderiales bacterium]
MRRALAALMLAAAAGLPGAGVAQPAVVAEPLTLARAEALLSDNNRAIAAARRALEQAQADVAIAAQRPNPQLSFAVQNINPNRGIGSGAPRSKTVDSVIRVDQLFERGGKAELRTDTARRAEAAAGEDVEEVTRQQLLGLRQTFYDLLAAQEKLLGAEQAAALFARTVEAAELRLKAGDLAAADVARIRVDALRSQNEARAMQGEVARGRVALAYVIGIAHDGPWRVTASWPALDAVPPAAARDADIEERADVRAARARVEAADKARELARALRTRDVSVGAQYEHWPNRADANSQGTGNSFGVAVSVPLFLRHQHEGEIARAQADWYAARDALEQVRAQARAELARAAGDLAAARERRSRFETALLPEALRAAGAAEFAFRNGAIGVMDLLDARRVVQAIQAELAAARADHARALAAFELGRGSPRNPRDAPR